MKNSQKCISIRQEILQQWSFSPKTQASTTVTWRQSIIHKGFKILLPRLHLLEKKLDKGNGQSTLQWERTAMHSWLNLAKMWIKFTPVEKKTVLRYINETAQNLKWRFWTKADKLRVIKNTQVFSSNAFQVIIPNKWRESIWWPEPAW